MAQKRIDVISPNIKIIGDAPVLFEEILKFANNKKYSDKFKDHQLKLIKTSLTNCTLGIVVTGQLKNVPPKKNKNTGVFSSLGISPNENLSFGNVCLYDNNVNVIFYEVNANGCYIDKFAEYLQNKWNQAHSDSKIELSFNAVSRKGDYNRLLKMTYYKELTAIFANPTEILQAFKDDNSSTLAIAKRHLKIGLKQNSDKLIVKFDTFGKKNNKTGLARQATMAFVNSIRYILRGDQRKNVETLQVKGYYTDASLPKSLQPINLIADTFNIYIKLKDKEQQVDLQEGERKSQIEQLYQKYLPELKYIFGK